MNGSTGNWTNWYEIVFDCSVAHRRVESNTIPYRTLRTFTERLLSASGVDQEEAHVVAGVLVWSNLVGRHLHGVLRVSAYLARFRKGLILSPCSPTFQSKTASVEILDGGHGFGQYVGHLGMTRAIEIAEKQGVGVVAVRGSNHFGNGAYYVDLAAGRNKIGIALSNSAPRVAPHGASTAVFGTNPFSFGAPTKGARPVLVDFSTGMIAGAAIRQAIEEKERLPEGSVVDAAGLAVSDPREAVHAAILPFGGAKGFGLGLAIEILCGIVTGAGFSHQIASLYHNLDNHADIGHFFLAMQIDKLLPLGTFFERMDQLIAWIKDANRLPGVSEILIPGESRWREYEQQIHNGVRIDQQTMDLLGDLAAGISVPTPW